MIITSDWLTTEGYGSLTDWDQWGSGDLVTIGDNAGESLALLDDSGVFRVRVSFNGGATFLREINTSLIPATDSALIVEGGVWGNPALSVDEISGINLRLDVGIKSGGVDYRSSLDGFIASFDGIPGVYVDGIPFLLTNSTAIGGIDVRVYGFVDGGTTYIDAVAIRVHFEVVDVLQSVSEPEKETSTKRINYKVYGMGASQWDVAEWDQGLWDGGEELVSVWTDVLNDLSFRTVINGGSSELKIRLAREFNNFGEGQDVSFNNRVDVYVYDREAPEGERVYRGRISAFEPSLADDEYVEVTVLGVAKELTDLVLEDAGGNTTLTYSGMAHDVVIKDIIDKYQASGGAISYTPTSISGTGVNINYTFKLTTIKDALDKIVELSPSGWHYFVDASGVLNYRPTDFDSPTHELAISKSIKVLKAPKTIEQIVNRVYFVGGEDSNGVQLYKRYDRPGSQSTYGIFAEKMIDQRVTDPATAQRFADFKLDTFESPITRATIEVLDSNNNEGLGYDVESIKPGDSIQITNISFGKAGGGKWDVDSWDTSVWDFLLTNSLGQILQVVSVSYGLDSIEIEVADRQPEVSRKLNNLEQKLEQSESLNIPVKPQ